MAAPTSQRIDALLEEHYRAYPLPEAAASWDLPFTWDQLFAKIFYIRPPEHPIDRLVSTLPASSAEEILHPAVQSRLSSEDSRWERIYHRYFQDEKPTSLSWREAFYAKKFSQDLGLAYGEFLRFSPATQAFYIENKESLTALDFSRHMVSDKEIETLSRLLPKITYCSVQCCHRISSKGILSIAARHPELKDLHITGMSSLDREALVSISRSCSQIEHLSLQSIGSDVTPADLLTLIQNNPISSLHLSDFSDLDDDTLAKVILSSKNLRSVKLHRCPRITPDFFAKVFEKCSHLKELHISCCAGFRDEAVTPAPEHYSLDTLEMTGCPLSLEGMQRIRKKFPYIITG